MGDSLIASLLLTFSQLIQVEFMDMMSFIVLLLVWKIPCCEIRLGDSAGI